MLRPERMRSGPPQPPLRTHSPGSTRQKYDKIIKEQGSELADANRKIEAMQLTLMDFQVVLTSHEREVEGLWVQKSAASEVSELRSQIAVLTERIEASEMRSSVLPGVVSPEMFHTFDARLQATQDSTMRETELLNEQIAAIKNSIQNGVPALTPIDDDLLRKDVERQFSEMSSKITSQQLTVVDTDRRLTDKVSNLTDLCSKLMESAGERHADDHFNTNGMQDVQNQLLALKENQQRSANDSKNATLVFQGQCNEVLKRHNLEIKDQLMHQKDEFRKATQLQSEKTAAATRAAESCKMQVEELVGISNRMQSQLHESDISRKEDIRVVLQQTSDSCNRVQQSLTSDINRLQKDTSQEMQRFEDSTNSFYRALEELRGIQQRTLEEYHRQGDEQAILHAKFQQQISDSNNQFKEQLVTESDNLQAMLRTESQSLSDHIFRIKTDVGERVGTCERRCTENENAIDVFRTRVRTLEMNDSTKLEKSVDDLKQRQNAQDSHMHVMEGWRSEAVAKLVSMEGRLNEAGNASQLATLGRRVDEVERGLVLCRGPEREDLKRNLKVELDDKFSLFEGHFMDGLESAKTRISEQENVLRDISKDLSKELIKVKQNTDKIGVLEEQFKQEMRTLNENIQKEIEPKIENCHQKMSLLQKDIDALRAKNASVIDQLKTIRSDEADRAQDVQLSIDKIAKDLTVRVKSLEDFLFSADSKIAELRRMIEILQDQNTVRFGDFDKLREELKQNNEEDARREENIKKMIRDIVQLRDNISKEIEDMKGEMKQNRHEHDKRQEELNSMLEQYSEEFNRTRADLNENKEADERRERQIAESMERLKQEIENRNRQAVHDMQQISMETQELGNEMAREFGVWRDTVGNNTARLSELDGFVTQITNSLSNESVETGKKFAEFEMQLKAELARVRRALEKAQE